MAILIGFAVASFAAAGLVIFLFRYRGTRARLAGLSAFTLGLAVIAVFILIHATVGPDHPAAGNVAFVSHVIQCMVELLLLGAVLSLRDPPGTSYRNAEVVVGLVLAALAILCYGGVAAWAPREQHEVPRIVFFAIPLLIGVALVARFGYGRDGLVGGGVFLALVASNLVYFFFDPNEKESRILRAVADSLQMFGYLGMLAFFYLVANNAELARTPWPGGSLGINLTRAVSAGLLALGLTGCGYFFSDRAEPGMPDPSSSVAGALALLVPAAAFAGCFVGVFGLTTGRSPLTRPPVV